MRIFFAPEYPEGEYFSLALLIHQLGYSVTRSPEDDFDVGFLWQDSTHVEPPSFFREIRRSKPVLNLACVDISKRRVEQAFQQVFGYGSFVDPATYDGRYVRKSDENAVGGGAVMDRPEAEPRDGWVYQRLVDSACDGVQVEYRTPVVLGEIPVVNVWRQEAPRGPLDGRKWLETTSVQTGEIYSPQESQLILEFCAEIGLDFGEVDVLRSREDGRLYVLDANKTPAGYGMLNRVRWRPEDKQRSLDALARCLDRKLRALLADDG